MANVIGVSAGQQDTILSPNQVITNGHITLAVALITITSTLLMIGFRFARKIDIAEGKINGLECRIQTVEQITQRSEAKDHTEELRVTTIEANMRTLLDSHAQIRSALEQSQRSQEHYQLELALIKQTMGTAYDEIRKISASINEDSKERIELSKQIGDLRTALAAAHPKILGRREDDRL